MNDKNFIEELRQKREEYGVTQRKLAVACGISRTYFNQIENGTVVPSAELKQTIEKQIERFNPQEPLCVIDNAVKTIQKKNNKCGIGNRGKTKIVVKEHFSEKGKTMEELLTDVMLEKAKQTIA